MATSTPISKQRCPPRRHQVQILHHLKRRRRKIVCPLRRLRRTSRTHLRSSTNPVLTVGGANGLANTIAKSRLRLMVRRTILIRKRSMGGVAVAAVAEVAAEAGEGECPHQQHDYHPALHTSSQSRIHLTLHLLLIHHCPHTLTSSKFLSFSCTFLSVLQLALSFKRAAPHYVHTTYIIDLHESVYCPNLRCPSFLQ